LLSILFFFVYKGKSKHLNPAISRFCFQFYRLLLLMFSKCKNLFVVLSRNHSCKIGNLLLVVNSIVILYHFLTLDNGSIGALKGQVAIVFKCRMCIFLMLFRIKFGRSTQGTLFHFMRNTKVWTSPKLFFHVKVYPASQ
jgi:hypothetical protein